VNAVTGLIISCGLLAVALVALWLMAPVANRLAERTRIEQERQVAAWRIHQQATQAFGQMLEAARGQREEGER
jgi:uncharacterized protein (UPF0261 family)